MSRLSTKQRRSAQRRRAWYRGRLRLYGINPLSIKRVAEIMEFVNVITGGRTVVPDYMRTILERRLK